MQVGNVPVSCTKIPLISLDYEPPRLIVIVMLIIVVSISKCFSSTIDLNIASSFGRIQPFKTIEASLRVDAIASAGFKISRSKLVDSIRYSLLYFC